MYCTKCGKFLPDGTKFCTGCGAAVSNFAAGAAAGFEAGAQQQTNQQAFNQQPYDQGYAQGYYNAPPRTVPAPDDAPSTGFGILGFFIPLVGLILYLVWKDEYPRKAKSAGKGALIGFIVGIVMVILVAVVMPIIFIGLADQF